MRYLHRTSWSAVSAFFLLVCGCREAKQEIPRVSRMWPAMGTFCSLTVESSDKPTVDLYEAETRKTVDDLEQSLSIFRPDSDVSRLNANAGAGALGLSGYAVEILRLSRHYAEKTGGCFDPTVAPLVSAWGFALKKKPETALAADAVRRELANVGYAGLVVSGNSASLARAGMSVNLGGIAKGYAVDVAWRRLVEKGAGNVMVDLGGNLRCGGTRTDGRPWRVGVRHPFDKEAIVGVVALSNGLAVATSGNYERFVVLNGKRYAHIIDPRTGTPVEGMAQVTVVSTNATETDALSTGLFVMKMEAGFEFLKSMPGCDAMFVPDKQPMELHVTPGFLRRFEPDASLKDSVIVHR